jgi:hypothetical protein
MVLLWVLKDDAQNNALKAGGKTILRFEVFRKYCELQRTFYQSGKLLLGYENLLQGD